MMSTKQAYLTNQYDDKLINQYADKLIIRRLIERYKQRYTRYRRVDDILRAAILKGLYIATGGRKGIIIPNNFDFVVLGSIITFTYMVKLDNGNDEKALEFLNSALEKNNKFITVNECCKDNLQIAKLLSAITFSNQKEQPMVTRSKITSLAYEILCQLERRSIYEYV